MNAKNIVKIMMIGMIFYFVGMTYIIVNTNPEEIIRQMEIDHPELKQYYTNITIVSEFDKTCNNSFFVLGCVKEDNIIYLTDLKGIIGYISPCQSFESTLYHEIGHSYNKNLGEYYNEDLANKFSEKYISPRCYISDNI